MALVEDTLPGIVHVTTVPRAGPPPPKPGAEELALAIDRARANLAARPGDAMLHQQLHQRLLADPTRQAAMLDHAREIPRRAVEGVERRARVEGAADLLEKDPAFKPSSEHVVPLAKIAMSSGQRARSRCAS
jgi:hypothetical protein